MNVLKKMEKAFGLNEDTWMNHANPWSVWTRFLVLPLLALITWNRMELGWTGVLLIGGLIFWTWINPRFFKKPTSTKHWSSKAVFGERVWLNKKNVPIPKHHLKMIAVLNIVTAMGLPFLVFGLVEFNVWLTVLGLTLVILGKMWFLDRMVWLYEDMKSDSKEYSSWEY